MDINEAHDIFNHQGKEALQKNCKHLGIKLTGTFQPCPGCMYAKAKQKKVNKLTKERATKSGERLFFDTSGPYPRSLGGNLYWLKIVDDYSRKNWNFLMKKKSEVAQKIIDHIKILTINGNAFRFVRCDNAGEHNEIKRFCERNNIIMEMTTPNTPQLNGVVERSFATELNYIRAMFYQAKFTPAMISNLWGMAVLYLEKTRNMSSTSANEKDLSPNQLYDRNEDLDTDYIQPLGRMGFVTIRTKIRRKLARRSFKAFMVGKPKNNARDAYYMYNPKTCKVIISRDIQWAPYNRPKFESEMEGILKDESTSSEINEKDKQMPIIYDSNSSDDENSEISYQGGCDELEIQEEENKDISETEKDIQKEINTENNNESKRMHNALKKINTSLNPKFTNPERRERYRNRLRYSSRLREKGNSIHAITNNLILNEISEHVCNTATTSDPNTPISIEEALNSNDSERWDNSIRSEINNFLKRKSWEYVSREEAIKEGRKLIPCKWIFKIKNEINNSF